MAPTQPPITPFVDFRWKPRARRPSSCTFAVFSPCESEGRGSGKEISYASSMASKTSHTAL